MSNISSATGLEKGSIGSSSSGSTPYSGSCLPTSRFPNRTISRRSSWGMPMMSAKTRIGISDEMCSTKSNSPRGSASSITSLTVFLTRSSHTVTACGVNRRLTIARSSSWRGGSMSIIDLRASTFSGASSSSVIPPTSDEKVSESRWTVRMSSYRVTAQNPGPLRSGLKWTGSSRLSKAKISWGTAGTKMSGSDRSISSSDMATLLTFSF